MKTRLKQFRVKAGMSQVKIAKAVGVTQPNYQRWESGSAPIPDAKLKELARVLNTTPDAILGRHPPIEAGFYDPDASDELRYYGEVAIHFCGGGASLLLSITESELSRLHSALQGDAAFVTVNSLANQTVSIRTKAIADLYFSSEAYDDYGPEHGTYADHTNVQMPDARDWEIVEALRDESDDLEDFNPDDVKRVQERIMITDEQYKRLVADGLIKSEDLERERAKNQEETDQIFRLATDVVYQLSNGKMRNVWVDDERAIYNAFYDLTEFDGGSPADDMIRVAAEGGHRIVFINKGALDYVSIPTHRYEKGATDAAAEDLG
jgi:transcriptional regulator with XRE-family HTH domain